MASTTRAQTTTAWDGGTSGTGTSWNTPANWVGDALPPSASNANILIADRLGTGTISTLSISSTRSVGLLTFDNAAAKLATTLSIDTNGSGTTAQTLTLFTGVTLSNTNTTVAFRGSNGTLSVVLGANNTMTTSSGSYLQFSSGVVVSGSFGITLAGSGSVGLNAPNTFTGGVTVGNGSTLRLGTGTQSNSSGSTVSGGVLVSGQAGTGTIVLQDGSSLISGGTGQRTMQNNLSMSGNITFGATSTFTGTLSFNSASGSTGSETLTTPATVTLTGNTTLTTQVDTSVSNVISGAFSLSKQGPGTLTTNASNTYSGGTNVLSGVLQIGRTGSLGATSGVVRLGSVGGGNASLINYLGGWTHANPIEVVAGSGGTLTLGYTSTAAFSSLFSGAITLNDDLTLQSEAADGFAMRLTGSITGSRNITKTGVGVARFENNNTGYSGVTTISAGTLQIGNASTTGGIGSGDVINNAALRVNRSNAYTLVNAISGTGSLTQAGAGTTTITTANTYSGGTTVSTGSLIVANTTGSATGTGPLTTAVGTTLGGSGTIAPTGASAASLSGTVSPGISSVTDGVGVLTFTPVDGNVKLESTSNVLFQLRSNGTNGLSLTYNPNGTIATVAGTPSLTGNDRLIFNASGTGMLDFTSAAAGSIGFAFVGGYTPQLLDAFDLLDWTNLSVIGLNDGLLNLPVLSDPGWTWDTSKFTSHGIIAIAAAVPEPSRAVLVGLGLGLLGLRSRRR